MRFLFCVFSFAAIAPAQDTTVARIPTPLSAPDLVSTIVRANRDSLFSYFARNLPPLSSEPLGMPPPFVIHEREKLSELPVESADTVVVGTVRSITSRVTSNQRWIYSEYAVDVETSLKLPAGLSQPKNIDVLEDGGAVTDANGRVFRSLSRGVGLEIEIGRDYLMFLNYQKAADCFKFVKVWEFRNGVAVATANDDIGRARTGTSTVNNMAMPSVISRVSSLITALSNRW